MTRCGGEVTGMGVDAACCPQVRTRFSPPEEAAAQSSPPVPSHEAVQCACGGVA